MNANIEKLAKEGYDKEQILSEISDMLSNANPMDWYKILKNAQDSVASDNLESPYYLLLGELRAFFLRLELNKRNRIKE